MHGCMHTPTPTPIYTQIHLELYLHYTYTFYTQNNRCFCIYFDKTPVLGVLGCIIHLQYTSFLGILNFNNFL